MATKVVMEALSPTMEEGRLVEWKKNEGDSVTVGDVLAEVETDKAVMELVARAAGTLLKQVAAAGSTVPVSNVVGWIGQPGEAIDGGAAPPSSQAPAADQKIPDRPAEPVVRESKAAASGATAVPPAPVGTAEEPAGRVKASPLARRIASERGVDLTGVQGSGPEGRIVKRDIDAAPAGASPAAPPAARPVAGAAAPFTDVPLTQIRKTIAKRLIQSIGPIPTFYLTAEVEMDRAWDSREALIAATSKTAAPGVEAPRVSFNDIVIKAVATALRQHPACNASWQDDHIRYWNEIHIGMAVAIEDGLITPVIRHADQRSLREINALAKELAARARTRKLKPEEYTGATFSVSNLGMFDIDHFTAIINPPEAAILAVGRIAEVPAAVNGQVAIRRRMKITMSCDHRVIDGATGAAFLRTLKMILENPLALVW